MIMYIVKAKLKQAVPNYSIASDFAEALNQKVETLLKEAARRAEANGRKTVMAKDL
ncbi:MAG: histone-like protein [Nanoarchaeota archaeon]